MGGAMVEGFARCGVADAADITAAAPHEATLSRFRHLGVTTTTDNRKAARAADIIVIAVKPHMAEQVVKEIQPVMDYSRQTLISVAAGITAAQLKTWLGGDGPGLPAIFLAIPNIAIAVGSSMTFIVNAGAGKEQEQTVGTLFRKTGGAFFTDERLLPAGMVLASCGIAYALRYIRAAAEGGVELGFKAADAQRIVMQTVKGAVALLDANGGHPEAEIDKVTTPGGITIRGLNEMEHAGFTSSVIRGLKAAGNR